MIKNGGGSIVNIASIGGIQPDVSRLGYGTSKNAIIYLSNNIAIQYAKQGVRCNVVAPGMIGTNAVKDHMTPEFQKAFLKHVPLDAWENRKTSPMRYISMQVQNLHLSPVQSRK